MSKEGISYTLPKREKLAHLPTPVELLPRLSQELRRSIFVKRDDFTGFEVSGNKVRKLEFALHEALSQGARVLITCGGLQSNHARATAAVARKRGLHCHLVLRGDAPSPSQGNLLLDGLFGATITTLSPQRFQRASTTVMEELKAWYDQEGLPAYILPMGASNAIGTFGYVVAYEEILSQEGRRPFDAILCAVGSGGTYAGLVLGNILHGRRHRILGVPVCDDAAYFREITRSLVEECLERLGVEASVREEDLLFLEGFVGRGYALSTPEELEFLKGVARKEGLLLDPVYTGKAFRGMVESLKTPLLQGMAQLLFLHSGGQFGLFPLAKDLSLFGTAGDAAGVPVKEEQRL